MLEVQRGPMLPAAVGGLILGGPLCVGPPEEDDAFVDAVAAEGGSHADARGGGLEDGSSWDDFFRMPM